MGMTGIPVINVNNNCATGSTALYVARGFIAGGMASCVLALGFEKMNPGSLGAVFDDRENPVQNHFMRMVEIAGMGKAPPMPQVGAWSSVCWKTKWGLWWVTCHAQCLPDAHSSSLHTDLYSPPDVRKCRQGAHGEVRHHTVALGQDCAQEPQAQRKQPILPESVGGCHLPCVVTEDCMFHLSTRYVPSQRRAHAGPDHGLQDHLWPTHQTSVLPYLGEQSALPSTPHAPHPPS